MCLLVPGHGLLMVQSIPALPVFCFSKLNFELPEHSLQLRIVSHRSCPTVGLLHLHRCHLVIQERTVPLSGNQLVVHNGNFLLGFLNFACQVCNLHFDLFF